jgi:hypothetical protein
VDPTSYFQQVLSIIMLLLSPVDIFTLCFNTTVFQVPAVGGRVVSNSHMLKLRLVSTHFLKQP